MLRGAISIFRRDLLVMRRSIYSELLAVLAYPLTLYFAFGIGMKGYISSVDGVPYPVFIAPGLISMTAVTAAFDESAWSMWFHRKVQRTIEEYRTAPITTYDIVIGKIISGFAQGAIKGVAVAAVILTFTAFTAPLINLATYLLFIAGGSMIFSCVGTICGTMIDKPENIGRFQAVLIIPLIFMSGVFFPLSSYPAQILPLIRLLPTTAIFDGARQALLTGRLDVASLAVVIVTALVAFIVTVYLFNRKIAE
jgi:lipooligosaccharide transport system permease protein